MHTKTKNKLVLTVGPSSSGKSTYARSVAESIENTFILNRDEIRLSMFGLQTLKEYKHSRKMESLVTEIQVNTFKSINKLFANSTENFVIIVADTNLNPVTRHLWDSLANEYNMELVFVYNWHELSTDHNEWVQLKDKPCIPLDILLDRNKLRGNNPVPENVIVRQYARYMEFLEEQNN